MRRYARERFVGILGGVVLSAVGVTSDAWASVNYDWLQFNGDPQHSGNNTSETRITHGNVGQLALLFRVTLPAVADGAPVVLTSVSTSGGLHDLLFLNTKDGRLLALDAQSGAVVWSIQHGPGTCQINGSGGACYTTSSPAVDPGRGFVYSYGLDGNVHKHAVATGVETLSGGWPEVTSLKGIDDKGSSPLTFATSASGPTYLYATHGGYPGDNGNYQGHLTAINLATGAQTVFNSLCSDQAVHFVEPPGTPDCSAVQSAIWARSGVVYDAAVDRIYVATGNGNYTPSANQWGDSVLALAPGGTGAAGRPLDSYTPPEFQSLQNADLDLGSTAPAILPVPSGSNVSDLAVQSGKDGKLRLLNLRNLSSLGGPGNVGGSVGSIIAVPQGGQVVTAIAVWVNPADASTWAFVANASGVSGLRLAIDGTGTPSLTTVWQNATAGSSPLIANGILYVAGAGHVRALDPATGTSLWQGTIGGTHWESPVVANGVLYIMDESAQLSAFTPPPQPVQTTPALPRPFLWSLAALILVVGLRGVRPVGPRRRAVGTAGSA
jgi:outer membrane protein assembly factor BamB